MKTLIFSLLILLLGCVKPDDNTTDFIGVWKTNDFRGRTMEITISRVDDNTISISDMDLATVKGNTFESYTNIGLVHTGELNAGILYYCHVLSVGSICGDFN